MTQEERELLLKDLCSRIPYQPMVNFNDTEYCDYKLTLGLLCDFPISKLKAYLRPMSSMTEEEKIEYNKLLGYCQDQDPVDYNITILDDSQLIFVIDWLNEHHFDYRGLISMGIALEATEGMYNIK